MPPRKLAAAGAAALALIGAGGFRVTTQLAGQAASGCARQSDGSLTVSPGGCGFASAYAIAAPGEAIVVEPGQYPGEVIPDAPAKDGQAGYVTFIADPANRDACAVYVGADGSDMQIRASGISFVGSQKIGSNFCINKILLQKLSTTTPQPTHFFFTGIHTHSLYARSASDILWTNSEAGPALACWSASSGKPASQQCPPATSDYPEDGGGNNQFYLPFKAEGLSGAAPGNITIDNVWFHDENTRDIASLHGECIFIGGGQGYSITRSEFTRCAVYGIFFQCLGGCQARDVRLENNLFEGPVSSAGTGDGQGGNGFTNQFLAANGDVQIDYDSGTLTNWRVAYNTFRNGFQFNRARCSGCVPLFSNFLLLGNLGELSGCFNGTPGFTAAFNVTFARTPFNGGPCGANQKILTSDPLTSVALTTDITQRPDYSLVPGAGAIDAADPSDYPATDFLGLPRFAGLGPDAGAEEFGAAPPPPPTTTTETTTESTSSTTDPTTTTAPAAFTLALISEDASTLTLGWTPVPGVGYRFSAEKQVKPDGSQKFSVTWDPNRASVKFAKGSAWYRVEALAVSERADYP